MVQTGIFLFFARLVDVSLNTLKFKSVMRGSKLTAATIAFFEVIIYTTAASQAFKYVNDPVVLVLYALGYASGNYLGIIIDDKLSKGILMLTIISNFDKWALADSLREKGYGVTTTKGYGKEGSEKSQLTVVLDKNKLDELTKIVGEHDPNAYIINTDVKSVFRNTSK